ncbi:MAG: hypothetical protein Q9208_001394 [Pyrenodesmia sp. 3 TL-2023]
MSDQSVVLKQYTTNLAEVILFPSFTSDQILISTRTNFSKLSANAQIAELLQDQSIKFEAAEAESMKQAVAALKFYNGVESVLKKLAVAGKALTEMFVRTREQMNRLQPLLTLLQADIEVESAFTPGRWATFRHDVNDLKKTNIGTSDESLSQ